MSRSEVCCLIGFRTVYVPSFSIVCINLHDHYAPSGSLVPAWYPAREFGSLIQREYSSAGLEDSGRYVRLTLCRGEDAQFGRPPPKVCIIRPYFPDGGWYVPVDAGLSALGQTNPSQYGHCANRLKDKSVYLTPGSRTHLGSCFFKTWDQICLIPGAPELITVTIYCDFGLPWKCCGMLFKRSAYLIQLMCYFKSCTKMICSKKKKCN